MPCDNVSVTTAIVQGRRPARPVAEIGKECIIIINYVHE